MGRRGRAAATLVGLVVAGTACTIGGTRSATSGTAGKRGGVFRLGITEPTAIDPYNSQESEAENVTRFDGQNVTEALFEGLVTLNDKTSELQPGVAERWVHDPACSRWTFHLRAATKFSNGEVVTAQSFIDGMTRAAAASGEDASDTAHFMDGIEGYDAVHGGADGAPPAATALSGLSAPDATTLVVRLARPNCEFDKLTLQPVFSPVPTVAGKADPSSAYFASPIGNGPFKMSVPWNHNVSIILVRNDQYYGTKPYLDEVDFAILPADSATELEYKNFQDGHADWARIPTSLLPQARATYGPRKEFLAMPRFGTNYLLVNVANPPLNDPKARRAVSLAIDRDAVINDVFGGFQTRATSLVPPPLADYYQPGVCTACGKPDRARARTLARQGGIPPGTKVSFSFNTGGGHEGWVEAVAQQLRDTLGLDIDLQPMSFAQLVQKEEAPDATGLYRASWGADYPSADDFLRPLLASASVPPGDNRGRYQNPEFDSLLDRALTATDPKQKVALTKRAEKLAIGDDLALIPLWYRTQYRVYSNKFTDVSMDLFENPTLADIRRA
ncbi:MAG TPA: peptide ABC transporter substrate-binding protein [Acidimicrobiales bacterium]|nr:peptide ABC transporter substrate-binding protein [Acidimicrobiales bacterium]